MSSQHMHSIAILFLGDVIPHIGPRQTMNVQSHVIGASSLRLMTFKVKGCDCMKCGAKGAFFSVETHTRLNKQTGERRIMENGYHLNLYGRRANGTLVLMTHDHVWPRARGGYDILKNSVTMCQDCNQAKKDRLPTAEEIAKWGCAYDPNFTHYPFRKPLSSQPKKVRTPEEIAEKERRRAEWQANNPHIKVRAKA